MDLPAATPEERAKNVEQAIECYRAALEIRKKDEYPVDYAMTQNNLGTAYADLPAATPEERAKNIRAVIDCFRAVLEIYKEDEYPVQYAMTQNNLGAAYTDLPAATPEERTKNIRAAIECFRAALEISRKDEYPQDYCQTAANLGLALAAINNPDACYWLEEAYALREYLGAGARSLKRSSSGFVKKISNLLTTLGVRG
jgi:tetratricopeptide (TPR) repeat protein